MLADHVATKRKLVPRFVHSSGRILRHYSWERQIVPEAVWIALIVDHCGYEVARKICIDLARAASYAVKCRSVMMFNSLSEYRTLSNKEREIVISRLDQSVILKIDAAMRPLFEIAPNHPLSFMHRHAGDELRSGDRFPVILKSLYDRNSRFSILSMSIAYESGIERGRIHIAPHMSQDVASRFNVIGEYPDTDDARKAAGYFRAAAPMIFGGLPESEQGFEIGEGWAREFWDAVAGHGSCRFVDTLCDAPLEEDSASAELIVSYQNAVRADLRERLKRWPLDLKNIEVYEVISALLSRQATLAIEFASAPSIWTPHTAPILLRAIADVFITISWILKDPAPRSRKFVEDGLGAIKLQIAHQQRALEQTDDPDEKKQIRQMIEIWRSWLSAQRMEQFVEVNLGSWSGLNNRKMAEESGCLDFYNHVYQPFSGVAHSNWAHVSTFNTVFCENPAHRHHRVPAIPSFEPDPHWLFLVTKYLTKTLYHFDEMNNISDIPFGTMDFLHGRLSATSDLE